MKILYAIQGTGNGHISRARDIIPHLQEKGEVDILISGTESDVDLNIPVTYKFKGLSFVFGKKGGIDLVATYKKSKLFQLFKEIKSLPIHKYDIVISDFEPVSSWACRINKKKCVGLSHQAAVSNKKSPKPKKFDPVGNAILKYYAPVDFNYGFHFEKYDDNISTPVIRTTIRNAKPKLGGHYTVYLPAYSDEKISKVLGEIKNINWQVFSKTAKEAYQKKNIKFLPIDDATFIKSMVNSLGILCGAGFETPAEALYLGKKLMVIPMRTQYEQQCNAAALKKLGVQSIKSLKRKHLNKIEQWIEKGVVIKIRFPDNTAAIVSQILKTFQKNNTSAVSIGDPIIETISDLKKITYEKMLSGQSK